MNKENYIYMNECKEYTVYILVIYIYINLLFTVTAALLDNVNLIAYYYYYYY